MDRFKSPPRPASAPMPNKVWHVGTLTYTSGALAVLFCWLLWGDFAWQLKERTAPPVVQLMLRKFDASDFLTGFFLLSLPAVIGIFLGPIISYQSDRHRGRWGRRIPYLLITSPIATFAMYGLAFSPWIGTWLHARMGWAPDKLNLTIIIVLGLAWTLFEFATVTANAVFGGLINDVVPRKLIGRFFGIFRAVSLISGIFFNYYLIGHAKEFFLPILIGIGTLYGGGVVLMCLMVKEGEYPTLEETGTGNNHGLITAVKAYARDCFSHPYYLLIFASMSLAQLAFLPINLFSVYAAETFGLTMDSYGKIIVVIYIISLALAYPLGWMADRFHATRVGLGALAAYAVLMAAGFWLIKGPTSFSVFYLFHGVIAGSYLTGAAALAQMLFPKLKFAQFVAAGALLFSLCSVVFGPAVGIVLDWLEHEYRYTFALSGIFGFMALLFSLIVYRRFMALGGPSGYEAPQ